MDIYFAPLEGVTDVIYRRVHHACFSGVTKYFIPFISPTQQMHLTNREMRSVDPSQNAGIPVVPQILTKYPGHFVGMARMLADMGYDEVNLNLGCPSGTVTAKGKGSGLLRELTVLKAFLDEIFENCPIAISVKTRVGFETTDEWPALMDLLARYPIKELTVHPRTRSEFYNGTPHRELCAAIPEGIPFVYNGDLFTAGDCARLAGMYPGARALMLGRGLIANPALAQETKGGPALTRDMLRDFHDRLYMAYSESWPANAVVGRMHEIMHYMGSCFENSKKPRKAIRKANTAPAYLEAVNWLFSDFPLRENPGFIPES